MNPDLERLVNLQLDLEAEARQSIVWILETLESTRGTHGGKRQIIRLIRDHFDLYRCGCCGRNLSSKHFIFARRGKDSRRWSYCSDCVKLVGFYGSRAAIPPDALPH